MKINYRWEAIIAAYPPAATLGMLLFVAADAGVWYGAIWGAAFFTLALVNLWFYELSNRMVMENTKLDIRVGKKYLFEPLRDEVVCIYVTLQEIHVPQKERVAVFEFAHKVAAFHAIPITLPLLMCDEYLAEIPEAAKA